MKEVKISELDLKSVEEVLANGLVPVAVEGVDTFAVPLAQIVGAAPSGPGSDPDPAPAIDVEELISDAVDEVKSWAQDEFLSKDNYLDEIDLVSNDEVNLITKGTDKKLHVAGPRSQKIFGAKWRRNKTFTAWERTRDSANYTFTPKIDGVGGSSSFDNQPIYRDIRLVNTDVNGNITSEEGDPGFSRNPASGDVMVRIPKFHYDIIADANNMEIVISDQPFANSKVSPRHAPHAGAPNGYEYILVSAYTLDSNYRSKSGNQSQVSITRAAARTGIHGRGAKYWQYDFLTYRTICLLYLVEAANWDSQEVVGKGYTGGNAQQNTGGADNIGYHSGSTVAGNVATGIAKYRHMENLWGNIWQWVDGINFNDARTYIAANPSQYADDTASNYTELSYTKAAANGYQKDIGFDPAIPFAMLPTDAAGAEGQYIADYYYQGAGWRVCRVGGAWTHGAYAGLFAFSSSDGSANSGTSVGCRLLVLP